MSDTVEPRSGHVATDRSRDGGFTLPELLMTFVMMGLIIAVITGAISVILREQDNTQGRLNVARAEYSVGFVVPADLASAETVNTEPDASPCPGGCPPGIDLDGVNAVMMTWSNSEVDPANPSNVFGVQVNVQYHFRRSADGLTFELNRIECAAIPAGSGAGGSSWDCTQRTVLTDLPGPTDGSPFVPGVTKPIWVLQVSNPLAADATSDDPDAELADDAETKDAKRVVITINGGADVAGAGGGSNQVSITAGGTTRAQIEPDSTFNAPSFARARSRCGGPITLVVDDSGSIDRTSTGAYVDNMSKVEAGVRSFIDAFDGTPTEIQIVRFDGSATVVGGSASNWTKYWDMTKPTDVAALKSGANFTADGGTNWEDALFRTFYKQDGTVQQRLPKIVVFFTDGEPTFSRLPTTDPAYTLPTRGDNGVLPAKPAPLPPIWGSKNDGYQYDQQAFSRADHIADLFRSSTRFIGVGVGGITTKNVTWVNQPTAGYVNRYQRGSHQFYKVETIYEIYGYATYYGYGWYQMTKANYDYYVSRGFPSRTRQGTKTYISKGEYDSKNTTGDVSDGYHFDGSKSYSSPYLDYEAWPTGGSAPEFITTKTYPASGPYDGYDSISSESLPATTVLARLIAANDNGVRAVSDGSRYTNAAEADMYLLPNFNQLAAAFEAVALAECGGTVTLQTKLGGNAAPDPFQYQNSAIKESNGDARVFEPTVVTTNAAFATGTFDFAIPDGSYVTVDIVPQNLSDLGRYQPDGSNPWSCRAGTTPVATTPIDTGSPWKGIRIRVDPNVAINCVQNVRVAP